MGIGAVVACAFLGLWSLCDASVSAIGFLCSGGNITGILGDAICRLWGGPTFSTSVALGPTAIGKFPGQVDSPDRGNWHMRARLRASLGKYTFLLYLFPAGMPHAITGGLFCLRRLLGHRGLERLGLVLAATGAGYAPVALALSFCAAVL